MMSCGFSMQGLSGSPPMPVGSNPQFWGGYQGMPQPPRISVGQTPPPFLTGQSFAPGQPPFPPGHQQTFVRGSHHHYRRKTKPPPPLIACEREVLVPRPAHLIFRKKIIYDRKLVTVPVVQQSVKKYIIPKPIQFIRKVKVPIVVWTTYPVRTAKIIQEEQLIKQPYVTYQKRMVQIPRLLLIPKLCQPKPIRICIPKDCIRNYSVGAPNTLNIHTSNEDAYRLNAGKNNNNGYNNVKKVIPSFPLARNMFQPRNSNPLNQNPRACTRKFTCFR